MLHILDEPTVGLHPRARGLYHAVQFAAGWKERQHRQPPTPTPSGRRKRRNLRAAALAGRWGDAMQARVGRRPCRSQKLVGPPTKKSRTPDATAFSAAVVHGLVVDWHRTRGSRSVEASGKIWPVYRACVTNCRGCIALGLLESPSCSLCRPFLLLASRSRRRPSLPVSLLADGHHVADSGELDRPHVRESAGQPTGSRFAAPRFQHGGVRARGITGQPGLASAD